MANYEIMFIVAPNTSEDEIDKINAQIEGVITSAGGQIQKIEKMGKRRLAYEIRRLREGYFVLFALEGNGGIIKECERRLRVIESVMKYITVRVDAESRRLEKIRNYRQRRAARRSTSASTAQSGSSAEEAMQ